MGSIELLQLAGYKGIELSLRPAAANVLFGPNGGGKSNVLEAITATLDWRDDYRRDPLAEHGLNTPDSCRALVRGDDLLLIGFLIAPVPREDSLGVGTFYIAHGGGLVTVDIWLDQLPEMLNQIRKEALNTAESNADTWTAVTDAYAIVLDAWLSSRLFLLAPGAITWLHPPREECDERVVAAAVHIWRHREIWTGDLIPLVDQFIKHLVGESPYLETGGDDFDLQWTRRRDRIRPDIRSFVNVVRMDASTPALSELTDRVVATVAHSVRLQLEEDAEFHYPLEGTSDDVIDQVWFAEADPDHGTVVQIHPLVEEACVRLGSLVTEIAPEFVRDAFEIKIVPVSPRAWRANRWNRIRIELNPIDGSHPPFDLSLAASGIAVWVAYALNEALRQLTPQSVPQVFVIDEPERHLHPNAQRQAARWLAETVLPSSQAFVATHAVPFLDLPREDVVYLHVVRRDGNTIAESVSDDLLGMLAERASEAGLSTSEVLQLTRAILIVEGKHDERILSAYGRDLRQQRVVVLPMRGTRNYLALAELEFLRRHEVPLFVLFDNVRSAAIRGGPVAGVWSDEERKILELKRIAGELRFLSFDEPDIICALPHDVVQTVMDRFNGATKFPGWAAIKRGFKEAPPQNFKRFFAKTVQLQGGERAIGQFVDRAAAVIAEGEGSALPNPSLARAIAELVAATADRGFPREAYSAPDAERGE
jgi:hypothetical protein